MKKAYSAILATTLICGSVFTATGAQASTVNTQTVQTEKETETNFLQFTGTVSKIIKNDNGTFLAEFSKENETHRFTFDEKTIMLDNSGKEVELKEGMKFTAYVDSNKPMILIYPPQYAPEVVIVQTEESGTAKVDKFDKDFLNQKKDLIIKVNDETIISNLSGKKLMAKDVVDKEVVIFYDVVLESYPAQTSPSKIIVLESELSDLDQAIKIANEDYYVKNEVKMIPLRLVAQKLGFKVESTGKGAIISKGAVSFTVTRGSLDYGYNKSIRKFENAPALLEPNKTYVSEELLPLLIEHY
ncbi:stalk domain-containing protein [Ureibacillus composti]|nr:stalk domain-containing protein [Ureibacillus composti]